MFKTILVPVDITEVETARPAIDRAVALAHATNGTLRLVYVRSLLPVTYMEFIPPDFDREQQEESETKLAAGESRGQVA
jgi:nucleotide-binding universal stress UspA family protein